MATICCDSFTTQFNIVIFVPGDYYPPITDTNNPAFQAMATDYGMNVFCIKIHAAVSNIDHIFEIIIIWLLCK